MAANDDPLESLADAILDGTPIDWSTLECSDVSRPLIRRLRVLAELADVHRGTPRHAVTAETAREQDLPKEEAALWPRTWGHLLLLERVGRGAFGEVYRARDTRLDRDVALKLLSSESPGRRASSIIQEGRLLARVRHPNVVTIYGAEQIDDQVGLWMEFVEGRTLEQRLRERKCFTVRQTIDVGIQLGLAIAAVHDAGLLHRDIKSHNVMVGNDGRVVLMDFGTGWDLSDCSRPALAGTPLYLAPELLDGKEATVRSDVYALGVLLFHLLTGKYPIVGERMQDLRGAHAGPGRLLLSNIRPDVPQALACVIERATDPQPERRYESGAALADDLRASRTIGPHRAWAILVPLVVAVALLITVPARHQLGASAPGIGAAVLAARPVTSTQGIKSTPALSPDGTRIAFGWERYGEIEIYVKPVDGDATVRITHTRGSELDPAWSSDGRFLTFRRSSLDEAGAPQQEVLVVPADGGAERTLWRGGRASLSFGVDWSPDDRSVAVSARPSPEEPLRILMIDVSGQGLRWVTSPAPAMVGDNYPVFSPDGQSLAFVRNTGSASSLHVLQLANGGVVRLPVDGHDIRDVTWSADGRFLVFCSYRGGGRDTVWRVPRGGGAAELLAGIGEGASAPSVARHQGGMVYLHTFIDSDLYRADLSVQGPEGVSPIAASNRADTQADVSPDNVRVPIRPRRLRGDLGGGVGWGESEPAHHARHTMPAPALVPGRAAHRLFSASSGRRQRERVRRGGVERRCPPLDLRNSERSVAHVVRRRPVDLLHVGSKRRAHRLESSCRWRTAGADHATGSVEGVGVE